MLHHAWARTLSDCASSASPLSSLTMTTKTRRPYGKPPKITATVVSKGNKQVTVRRMVPQATALPDGGVRVQMVPIPGNIDIREVRPSDWKLIQVGDKLSLPSRRGPRLWGRAMTPKRKRKPSRFTFTFSSMEVRRVES